MLAAVAVTRRVAGVLIMVILHPYRLERVIRDMLGDRLHRGIHGPDAAVAGVVLRSGTGSPRVDPNPGMRPPVHGKWVQTDDAEAAIRAV
jgi:hypothetical protein